MRDDGIEGTFTRECADMQFIKDTFLESGSLPDLICPLEFIELDDLGRAVHSLWLKARCRIGKAAIVVKLVEILRAGSQHRNYCMVIAHGQGFHGYEFIGVAKMEADRTRVGCPQQKLPTAVW